MKQLQSVFQNKAEHRQRTRLALLVLAVERGLRQLDIPIAEIAPDEIRGQLAGHAQLVFVEIGRHLADTVLQAGNNPFVRGRKFYTFDRRDFLSLRVHKYKTGSIPQLVDKVAAGFHFDVGIPRIVAGRDARQQRQPQRVRAVFFDNLQRVDAVAQRFTHLAALLVADDSVNKHVVERYLARVLDPRENHSRHPEEYNIVSRHEHVGGIEIFIVLRFFGKSEGGKGPERGGKPGVQHVLVLSQLRASAFGAMRRVLLRTNHLSARLAIPNGNTVSPPKLAGNTPVAHVFHPVVISFGETLGHKSDFIFHRRGDRGLCERLHFYKPLLRDDGLHRRMAAVAMPHVVRMGFYLHEISSRLEILHHLFASNVSVQPLVSARLVVHRPVVVHDADNF